MMMMMMLWRPQRFTSASRVVRLDVWDGLEPLGCFLNSWSLVLSGTEKRREREAIKLKKKTHVLRLLSTKAKNQLDSLGSVLNHPFSASFDRSTKYHQLSLLLGMMLSLKISLLLLLSTLILTSPSSLLLLHSSYVQVWFRDQWKIKKKKIINSLNSLTTIVSLK